VQDGGELHDAIPRLRSFFYYIQPFKACPSV
jgi:hypothetical protein